MDNITQGVIGGSIYSLITKKTNNKNIWLGAIIANIPDFDVFISRRIYSDPVDIFFFHRGIMHSVIFNIGLSLLLGYALYRIDKSIPYRRYVLGCFCSILFGHLLIDGMTSYGMRYFLPWDQTVYSFDNMFVVDFGMRLITIGGFVSYHISKQKARIAKWILGIAGTYIALSIGIQQYVNNQFEQHYPQEITQTQLEKAITTVQPLQLALWKHIAKIDSGFYIADYSLFDTSPISRSFLPINPQAQAFVQDLSRQNNKLGNDLHKVLNFARGMVRIVPIDKGYSLENLLMGNVDPSSTGTQAMFSFELIGSGERYTLSQSQRRMEIGKNTWNNFWKRVRGEKSITR